MSDAPEQIWICDRAGEYGSYFPEAAESEGEYGGQAIKYIRADLATPDPMDDPRVKALVEAAIELRYNVTFKTWRELDRAIDAMKGAK